MRTYEKKDYSQICQWLSLRSMPSVTEKFIPESGLIVDDVAAGFLILMSNRCGMLDFFVSNPGAERDSRKSAFHMIIGTLISEARSLGCEMIFGNTQNGSMKRLVLSSGFKSIGKFECFCLEV